MSLTVLNETIHEREVLSSKFIACLRHTEKDEDFVRHLKEVKELYPKARHYCYGARIGVIEKMGDDGEPGHSAGLQILSTLRYKKLDNVSIVIVRYFGGIKLGLPRLTRTYREAAEEVILNSKVVEAKLGLGATLSIPYSELDSIRYQLNKNEFQILDIKYEEEVQISFVGEEPMIRKYLEGIDERKILALNETTLYKEVNL